MAFDIDKMEKWGMRLFENDQDLEVAFHLGNGSYLGIDMSDWEYKLNMMVFHDDRTHASPEALDYYKTHTNHAILNQTITPYLRRMLDANNCGGRLLTLCRAKERLKNSFYPGRYYTLIMGVLMMRAGAFINQCNLQHLWDLIPMVAKYYLWKVPRYARNFYGLENAGRVQLVTALLHYKPGVARNFSEESCHNCGFVQRDFDKLGSLKLVEKCRCGEAYYCCKDCREGDWPLHKNICLLAKDLKMIGMYC